VTLEQAKLAEHTMWHVKLNRPVAYERAPHKPKMLIPQAHRIQDEFSCIT